MKVLVHFKCHQKKVVTLQFKNSQKKKKKLSLDSKNMKEKMNTELYEEKKNSLDSSASC